MQLANWFWDLEKLSIIISININSFEMISRAIHINEFIENFYGENTMVNVVLLEQCEWWILIRPKCQTKWNNLNWSVLLKYKNYHLFFWFLERPTTRFRTQEPKNNSTSLRIKRTETNKQTKKRTGKWPTWFHIINEFVLAPIIWMQLF